jgi:hypothetical protein
VNAERNATPLPNETGLTMPYTIEEHQHRLAAWDAGRSASVKGCRFKVGQAKAILEACGFNASFSRTEHLPHPTEIDRTHQQWREAIIDAATQQGLLIFHKGMDAVLRSRSGIHSILNPQ